MKHDNINVINGNNKIIVSAPHSVMHVREGSVRPRETKTGVIARILANKCDTYGIYKLKNESNDANWDKECTYKRKVEEIINLQNIKALIDIHGMAAHRKQDICIGINGGKNIFGYNYIIKEMVEIFNKYGFNNITIDEPFDAKYEYCVSNYIARKCKIPTFQIEINLKYRTKKYAEYVKYNMLIKALIEVVELLEKRID